MERIVCPKRSVCATREVPELYQTCRPARSRCEQHRRWTARAIAPDSNRDGQYTPTGGHFFADCPTRGSPTNWRGYATALLLFDSYARISLEFIVLSNDAFYLSHITKLLLINLHFRSRRSLNILVYLLLPQSN